MYELIDPFDGFRRLKATHPLCGCAVEAEVWQFTTLEEATDAALEHAIAPRQYLTIYTVGPNSGRAVRDVHADGRIEDVAA